MSEIMIPATQYLLPDGRQRKMTTSAPARYAPNYQRMKDAGLTFGVEILRTQQVSLTIEDLKREVDVEIRIVSNGAEVPLAVIELLEWATVENIAAYLERVKGEV